MELLCFGFLVGVAFSLVVFGAGVLYDDRIYKRKRDNDCDCGVVCGGNSDGRDCLVGNNHGEVNCRRDIRPCDEADDGK